MQTELQLPPLDTALTVSRSASTKVKILTRLKAMQTEHQLPPLDTALTVSRSAAKEQARQYLYFCTSKASKLSAV